MPPTNVQLVGKKRTAAPATAGVRRGARRPCQTERVGTLTPQACAGPRNGASAGSARPPAARPPTRPHATAAARAPAGRWRRRPPLTSEATRAPTAGPSPGLRRHRCGGAPSSEWRRARARAHAAGGSALVRWSTGWGVPPAADTATNPAGTLLPPLPYTRPPPHPRRGRCSGALFSNPLGVGGRAPPPPRACGRL